MAKKRYLPRHKRFSGCNPYAGLLYLLARCMSYGKCWCEEVGCPKCGGGRCFCHQKLSRDKAGEYWPGAPPLPNDNSPSRPV